MDEKVNAVFLLDCPQCKAVVAFLIFRSSFRLKQIDALQNTVERQHLQFLMTWHFCAKHCHK